MAFSVKKRFLIYSIGSLFCLSYNTTARSLPINPDGTLGTTSEQIRNQVLIKNGTQSGSNLFHSFEQLSIPLGIEVKFMNDSGISDIFVRVTGGSVSNIDGILTTNNPANFWLANPNGVIIGSNAKFNIEGSFNVVAGGNITFADGSQFGLATNNDAILTSSSPTGVNFPEGRRLPGVIIIKGKGHSLKDQSFLGKLASGRKPQSGLQAKNFNILADRIDLDGAVLTAEGGNINLYAIERGQLSLDKNSSLNADRTNSFGGINVTNKSLLDVSSPNSNLPSGGVRTIANNINFNNDSLILSQNKSSTVGGNIILEATNLINITGENPRQIRGGIYSEASGNVTGKGSNISLLAPNISMQNANARSITIGKAAGGDILVEGDNLKLSQKSLIISITTNRGRSGDIQANFNNNIEILGGETNKASEVNTSIGVSNYGFGDSGELKVSGKSIFVLNGGSISSGTFPPFIGKLVNPSLSIEGTTNNVTVNAETLYIGGIDTIRISRDTLINGEITRQESATVPRAASVGTSTTNSFDAGNLLVNVKRLIINEGGELKTNSSASGNAGIMTINANTSIEVNNGTIESSVEPFGNPSNFFFQLFTAQVEANRIKIDTPILQLSNNSELTVSNFGNNNAGIADINADIIRLENSKFTATTKGGSGELNITAKDFRITNSQISTGAAASGTGGDINITSDIFVADRSSEILATAVAGNGGNINIKGESGVFINGIVSADSESGIDGTVKIEGVTQEEIGQQLSSTIDPKERQPTPEVNQISNKCIGEEVPIIKDSHGKPDASFDRYGDPRSNLAGLFLPEEKEPDPVIKENLAIVYLMQNAPEDPEMLEDYLNEHFNDVTVHGHGNFSTGKLKNPDKVPLPDFDELDAIYSVNYRECN
ncbi:MAG: filamentous hemagglutinin N-terminal domain-containing protein [Prochloraceae cyanobacterium]